MTGKASDQLKLESQRRHRSIAELVGKSYCKVLLQINATLQLRIISLMEAGFGVYTSGMPRRLARPREFEIDTCAQLWKSQAAQNEGKSFVTKVSDQGECYLLT